MKESDAKSYRMLSIYSQLQKGGILKKADLAEEFGVAERSIQRDMEAMRKFLEEQDLPYEIILDRQAGGYRLINKSEALLSNGEILTVCKILLESRSLRRDEMLPILNKLLDACVPQSSQDFARQLVSNEMYHYIEPRHGQPIADRLWDLGQAVQKKRVLEISYQKLKSPEAVKRTVKPVGLMFSEYYFYLIAFIHHDWIEDFPEEAELFPAIYRVDRIQKFRETGETFSPPYAKRFQEGEFRKRVQFMFGGKLRTVRFTYSGPSIEAVLDRLPTAEILSEKDGVYSVRAEVFGSGIEMWLRSQGDYVSIK